MVVPNHDPLLGIRRISSSPNQREDVASEEHFHHANAAQDKVPAKRLVERIRVIDPEAFVCTACEASIVLVEANMQQLIHLPSCETQPHPFPFPSSSYIYFSHKLRYSLILFLGVAGNERSTRTIQGYRMSSVFGMCFTTRHDLGDGHGAFIVEDENDPENENENQAFGTAAGADEVHAAPLNDGVMHPAFFDMGSIELVLSAPTSTGVAMERPPVAETEVVAEAETSRATVKAQNKQRQRKAAEVGTKKHYTSSRSSTVEKPTRGDETASRFNTPSATARTDAIVVKKAEQKQFEYDPDTSSDEDEHSVSGRSKSAARLAWQNQGWR